MIYKYEPLLTLHEIKRHGLTNQVTDERLLSTCLQDAQEIDLRNEIGIKIIRDLQEKKKNGTLATKEKELIHEYILPYIAKVVDRRAVIATSNRIRNAGTGSVNATEFRQNDLEENRRFRNELMWDEKVIARDLHKFLSENKSFFTLYKNADCCENSTKGNGLINKIFTI